MARRGDSTQPYGPHSGAALTPGRVGDTGTESRAFPFEVTVADDISPDVVLANRICLAAEEHGLTTAQAGALCDEVVPMLAAAFASLREQVRALTADNAALVGGMRKVAQTLVEHPRTASIMLDLLLDESHPGAAMLAEMEGLKSALDAAGVPTTPVDCDAEERPLSLAERVTLLARARNNFRGATDTNAALLESAWNERDSLRARVAELETERHAMKERMNVILHAGPNTALADSVFRRAATAESDRDAAQQRVRALVEESTKVRPSPYAVRGSEYEKGCAHGWASRGEEIRDAVEAVMKNTPEEG